MQVLLLSWHEIINGLSLFQALLHFNQQLHPINHHLDQVDLGESQTVSVGDIKDTPHSCSVHTTCREHREDQNQAQQGVLIGSGVMSNDSPPLQQEWKSML